MSEKSRITFASVDQAKLPFNLVLQGMQERLPEPSKSTRSL